MKSEEASQTPVVLEPSQSNHYEKMRHTQLGVTRVASSATLICSKDVKAGKGEKQSKSIPAILKLFIPEKSSKKASASPSSSTASTLAIPVKA